MSRDAVVYSVISPGVPDLLLTELYENGVRLISFCAQPQLTRSWFRENDHGRNLIVVDTNISPYVSFILNGLYLLRERAAFLLLSETQFPGLIMVIQHACQRHNGQVFTDADAAIGWLTRSD